MYYTANRILRNSRDAEDVVHQAFLKVIEILDTISSPRCHKTRALLVTITEHKAIDLYREKQRRNVLPLAEEYIGAAPAAEERYRADPLVQTAERLVRENPAGWQGTADELRKYDDIIYQPASYSGNSRRVHALYKKLTVC